MTCPRSTPDKGIPEAASWWVYLVRRADNALYTGIATDVERRFMEHSGGRGAKSLRGRGPLTLEACSPAGDRSLAQRVEARIKRLSKSDKERLAASRDALAEFIGSVDDGHRVEDET